MVEDSTQQRLLDGRGTPQPRHAARSEPVASVAARSHTLALIWFGLAVVFAGRPSTMLPDSGFENSWILGINLAAARHLRFGPDVLYTYGPWGYLDWPLNLTDAHAMSGLLFQVGAAAALFGSAYACLRRRLRPPLAAPIAFAVTVAVPVVARPSGMLVMASILASLWVLHRRGEHPDDLAAALLPGVGLAALSGVLLQVKINNGVAVLVLALIMATCGPPRRAALAGLGAAITAALLGFVLAWMVAGQRLGDMFAYLRGSFEISAGYREAQAIEAPGPVVGYIAAFALAVTVAGLVLALLRRGDHVRLTIGVALVAAAMLELGFKHGFIRHDAGHEPSFFLSAGAVLIALAVWFRRHEWVLAAGLCAIVMVPANLGVVDPLQVRDAWRTGLELWLDRPYRQDALADRQQRLREHYQLPSSILDAAVGHPVHIDPSETTVAWAYNLDWRPVPVFQLMSAYTPYLDQRNADAAVQAPADQVVLVRGDSPIDGRNPRWETPRYLLALACNYVPVAAQSPWMALRHGTNRCGPERPVSARAVAAGEPIDTPTVEADEILVTRFTPSPDNLSARATHLLLKDWTPIMIRADDLRYRVPESLVDGPLLTRVPTSLAWTQPFAAFSYDTLTFNQPGTVAFAAIPLGPTA